MLDSNKNKIKKVVANWKMNGSYALCNSLFEELFSNTDSDTTLKLQNIEIIICPPFVFFAEIKRLIDHYSNIAGKRGCKIKLGAQNCHYEDDGACTGEVSARMLFDLGCSYVIIGHSERRTKFEETDKDILKKVQKISEYKMIPIICIGEPLTIANALNTERFLYQQLSELLKVISREPHNFVIAYEPIWAIGSGKVADSNIITTVHSFIRDIVGPDVDLLYGGSINIVNAEKISRLEVVDGALIGGSCLSPVDFIKICNDFCQGISK